MILSQIQITVLSFTLSCFFLAADIFDICRFSFEARSAAVIAAPLAAETIFAVMLLRTRLIRDMNFSKHTGYSNERHFYSELLIGESQCVRYIILLGKRDFFNNPLSPVIIV